MKYKVGTRDSKLALTQTNLVCEALIKAIPSLSHNQFEIIKIKTTGDKILNKNLNEIGGKNLFIKEIEEALLEKEIDFAVHSLKDMTANLDKNLVIAAHLEREDPRDALVSSNYKKLEELPLNSIVGTSSVRRKFLALSYRSDLNVIPFRGNVQTRIDKLNQNHAQATFLAMAGLKRLNINPNMYTPLSTDFFLPAVSQGIIGVQCNKKDDLVYQLLRSINHHDTEVITQAERGFLECLEADCSLPIAAYATITKNLIHLECLGINSQGRIYKDSAQASLEESSELGFEMGLKFKKFLLS